MYENFYSSLFMTTLYCLNNYNGSAQTGSKTKPTGCNWYREKNESETENKIDQESELFDRLYSITRSHNGGLQLYVSNVRPLRNRVHIFCCFCKAE
jgi:hypothetical protein